MDFKKGFRIAEAEIVVSAAINESLTLANQRSFDGNAEPWDEERVAREHGASALDHFRAIRHHRDALKSIIVGDD